MSEYDTLPTVAKLRDAQRALAVSQADLTSTRASIVELLGILHRFQVAAGGDPNISYARSVELIVMQRAELASARQELAQLRGES